MPLASLSSRTPLRDGPFVLSAPPRSRNRTGLAIVLALICFSAYLFLLHTPASSHHDQLTQQLETLRHSHSGYANDRLTYTSRPAHRPSVKLTPSEELAAVSSFIASLPQNVLPASVDPREPIDPQLVLDFDTRSPQAADEVQSMVQDVWSRNPVFLYSKMYSPASRELKALLSVFRLKPSPTIIDVDTRDDADVLEPLLARVSGVDELPMLIIGGKPVGGLEDAKALHRDGDLEQLMRAAGAEINGARDRKGRKLRRGT